MQLDEDLDLVKRSDSRCCLVAFGDLRTRLILRIVSDQTFAREHLDQILGQANNAFLMADAIEETDGAASSLADHAIMIAHDGVHVFVRSKSNPSDVLCCICDSYDGVDNLLASAREFFGYMARVA